MFLLIIFLVFVRLIQSQSVNVVTLAGSTGGFNDAQGSNAQFNNPTGVSVDYAGKVYVADRDNHKIRIITASGQVSTLAGNTAGFTDAQGSNALFSTPYDVAVDSTGKVYVADKNNQRIRMITATGQVTTLAGQSTAGFNDAIGASAQFYYPTSVAVDSSGKVFVADYWNHKIRTITANGQVSTLAGQSTAGFNDAQGASAQFYYPIYVAVDSVGNSYVADSYNHAIRKITTAGQVSTLAGQSTNGYNDAQGSNAKFYYPAGLAADSVGKVYVADWGNHRIRVITSTGQVSTLAGQSTAGFNDAQGSNAQFNYPYDVAVDSAGKVYVADQGNNKIRMILSCTSSESFDAVNKRCNALFCASGLQLNSVTGQCEQCNSTFIKPLNGSQSCEACPIGTEANSNRTACTSCISGLTYRSLQTQTSCLSCPTNSNCTITGFTCLPNYKLNSTGNGCDMCQLGQESNLQRTVCDSCVAGSTYRSSLSQVGCQSCPVNSYCNLTAFTCYPGYQYNVTRNSCDPCPIGTEWSFINNSCVNCQVGFTRPDTVLGQCIPCPSGSLTCSFNINQCFVSQQATISIPVTSTLVQSSTVSSFQTSTISIFATITKSITTILTAAAATCNPPATAYQIFTVTVNPVTQSVYFTQTITNFQQPAVMTSTVTISVVETQPSGSQQSQISGSSSNSITIDFIGTLPISPLIFGIAAMVTGALVLFIVFLTCCRKPRNGKRRDDDFETSGITTTMLTNSQGTFTNRNTTSIT